MPPQIPRNRLAAAVVCLALVVVAAWLAPAALSAGGGAPAPLAAESLFVRKLALRANDVVHSPSTGMLYASVPSTEGAAGNTVTVIDPSTGAVSASVFIGSEPNRLALSDDGNTLYAALEGAYSVRRFDVQTQTPGAQFALGGDNFFGIYAINDMAVSPGQPDVVAVVRFHRGVSPPEAGVAIFDNGVQRPKTGPGHISGADYIAYSASPAKLYGSNASYGGLRTMPIDAQGVGTQTMTNFNVYGSIKFAGGLVFSSTGQVINPDTSTLLGTFSGANAGYGAAFVPDPANGRVYFVVREVVNSITTLVLKAYDVNTFLPLGTQPIPNVTGDPTTLIRWGGNGLALRTSTGDLYVIQTTLIPSGGPVPTPTPTPAATPAPTPATAAAFVRQLPLEANDLVYHAGSQRLYASVPSTAGAAGNSVTPIDPAAGTVGPSVFVGSEPNRLALSDDGQTMYVGLNGAGAVRRFDLPTQTAGAQFGLGVNGFDGPAVATDISVMPGTPSTVAVSRTTSGTAIYDDGTPRPQAGASGPVEFGAAASRLYVGGAPVQKYSVGPTGLTSNGSVATGRGGSSTVFDRNTGLLFTNAGEVINPEAGAVLGTFSGLGYDSSVAVDSAAGRVYFLTTTTSSSSSWLLRSYDLNTFRPIAEVNLGSITGTVGSLVRWGTNGLAFRVSTGFFGGAPRVYLVQTALVTDADPIPAPTPTPSPTPSPSPAYFPTFVRRVSLPANDLVYNAATARLYASVPSAVGPTGNSIAEVDPATGAVGPSTFVGSEPTKLALADDGRTLYVGLDGAHAVRRYDLQTRTPGIQFGVGVQRPADMEVVPGSPQSLAVSRGVGSNVVVFDDGVQRPNGSSGSAYAVLPIEFGATPDVLYGYDNYSSGFELVKFSLDASGVTGVRTTYNLISGYSANIEFAGGRLYASSGRVVDPEANTLVGTFTNPGGSAFTVDPALGRAFFIGDGPSTNTKVLRVYDLNTFLPIGSVTLNGISGSAWSLVRWGTNGLAFRTVGTGSSNTLADSQVYVIQSALVSPSEPVPTGVQLTSDRVSTFEGSSSLQLTVARTGTVDAPTSVDYAAGGGTATAGQDYTATSGTLTFAAGELSKIVTVPLLNDNVYEGTETFNLTLSNPTGGALLAGPASAVVTINDNDSRPFVSSQSAQLSEGNSGTADLSVNVTLSNASVETVSVNYSTSDETATAGVDYVATSGTLVFPPGTTAGVVKVPVKGDLTVEPNETFRLNFSGAVNSSGSVTSVVAQITNDDAPGALRFSAASYGGQESGGAVAVTVTRVGGVSGAVSVNYATGGGTATAGQDYTAASGTLTFAEGETSKGFSVSVGDDATHEADETVNLTLSAPTGGAGLGSPSLAVLTIQDDDRPTFQFSALNHSASEAAGKVELRVTRAGDPSPSASVNYATADGNASDTSDYNLTLGTLRFAPGETEKTITVLLTDDVRVEAPETFIVSLTAPAAPAALGTPATATVVVESDDATQGQDPVGTSTLNPDFFVRQHYRDFFNREADAPGLAFWTGQLQGCGADAACLELKKINVSAAFFLSIEFQGTGFYVYRMNQAAYGSGETLKMRGFMADAQEIGRGVTVGEGAWQQQLEANKQSYAERFASRPEFVSAYGGLSNAQFVDALNAHTLDPLAPGMGGALTQGERDQLVADLNSGAKTRAQALRAVAENPVFNAREKNRAFVLMQYFGYMRRNPNDPPNTDFSGYNFWLGKLNEYHGDYVAAEMVKSFLVAGEYRARFK